MVEDKRPTSAFFFKVFGTGLVLSPALGIASAITGSRELGGMALMCLLGAGAALVIAIILVIWEA